MTDSKGSGGGTGPDVSSGNPNLRRVSYSTRNRIRRVGLYVALIVTLLVVLFPIFWMISTAFRPTSQMFTKEVVLIPDEIVISHFTDLLSQSRFTTFYLNSIIISVGVVLITTTTATLGGYGLTRIDIPFKRTFARTVIFGYMFPPILLAIPMFIFWRQIGILNSYVGLIIAETAIALPFSLWLMWKFFQTVPVSLEESARMAGATRFQAFYDIALPMAKPGIIAVALLSYAISWDQYTMPKVLMVSLEKWPLTVGIDAFIQQNQVLWGQVMAASALTLVPSFIFVFFLQKYILRGFRAGGVG